MVFEEISVPFTKKKKIQNTQTKIERAVILPESISLHHVNALGCSYHFFNIYVNDYVVINEHIPSGG